MVAKSDYVKSVRMPTVIFRIDNATFDSRNLNVAEIDTYWSSVTMVRSRSALRLRLP
jgi:hypothetical protein